MLLLELGVVLDACDEQEDNICFMVQEEDVCVCVVISTWVPAGYCRYCIIL